MNIAVLDADVIAYQAASHGASSSAVRWDDHDEMAEDNLEGAIRAAISQVERWAELAGAEDVLLAFSGSSEMNFRRVVHPHYKSTRNGDKPRYYQEVVDYLQGDYEYELYECLEGDDVIGLRVTEDPEVYVGVSTDKDLQTLPGRTVRVRTNVAPEYFDLSKEEADWNWMFQTLKGDPVDDYKGAPGVGAVGAHKALDGIRTLGSLWEAALRTYGDQFRKPKARKKFITVSPYQEALMNARCARILRWGDFDYDCEEVNLWVPN